MYLTNESAVHEYYNTVRFRLVWNEMLKLKPLFQQIKSFQVFMLTIFNDFK